jgi:hypothetical protein
MVTQIASDMRFLLAPHGLLLHSLYAFTGRSWRDRFGRHAMPVKLSGSLRIFTLEPQYRFDEARYGDFIPDDTKFMPKRLEILSLPMLAIRSATLACPREAI